ncbi:MAG: Rpp14/Pop5 family protein [Candidatus Thermoplasmatota archaeon]
MFTIKTLDDRRIKKTDIVNTVDILCGKILGKSTYDLNVTLISFNGYNGILRCPHQLKDQMINLLRSIDMVGSSQVSVNTVKTSGTIKALLRRVNKK